MSTTINNTDFPLPAAVPLFSVISVGSFFKFEGGDFLKTSATTAFLFGPMTNSTFTDAEVRPVNADIVITPYSA